MLRFLRSAGFLTAMALLLVSCSKSSSTTGPGSTAPKLVTPTFTGPVSSSQTADTSAGYLHANGYATLFTAFSQGFTSYYVGSGTQSGNSWTWSYTASGVTGKWSATSGSNGYNWSLVLSGSSGTTTYDNWTWLTGFETTNGDSGNWTIYYENTNIVEFSVSWSTNASGVLTATILSNDTTGTTIQKDVITNNKDKSGELVEYAGSTMTWDIIWNADGSGHYTEWDDQGNVVATGTWS